ncbi:STM4015 family protein (plasmid) [Deinococcus taeanensis]|uniref:STM4015 family protein n=1 Tax=Deinococcus taeanensis TaxID=2737050 RepID=UPI001CDD3BB9|nr:STM4015 family protein [Deinococcus taeanensis]UBV45240.1 STM4015 family protein [Deinococcus taeanensis]
MAIHEHLTAFGGLQVVDWALGDPLPDPAIAMARLGVEWDDPVSWTERFRTFLELPGVAAVPGLVVGWWSAEDSDVAPTEVLEALVTARDRLPQLRVMFFGDITSEENEVSWIQQADLSALLAAYGDLTHFGVRGGNNLSLGRLDLPELRHLIIQAGGLPGEVIREVMSARLPRLEHLELYFGAENYGATGRADDLAPLLDGTLFPALRYLGLKNGEFQDELAQLLADAPVLEGLQTLDLSLGTFSDEGAAALLRSPRAAQLKQLIIRHHFCTPDMVARLKQLGPDVDAEEAEDPDDEWRFVALGE